MSGATRTSNLVADLRNVNMPGLAPLARAAASEIERLRRTVIEGGEPTGLLVVSESDQTPRAFDEKASDERLHNTRAWAAARIGQLSGADVIVSAIDELLQMRRDWKAICDAADAMPADEPLAAQFSEHDAGIIRDLEAMAADNLAGFWPKALAIGALRLIKQRASVPHRELTPSEAASFNKTLARSPRRVHDGFLLCYDCPPAGYPTDWTRCAECPRTRSELRADVHVQDHG